jgi:hypothetical protein
VRIILFEIVQTTPWTSRRAVTVIAFPGSGMVLNDEFETNNNDGSLNNESVWELKDQVNGAR